MRSGQEGDGSLFFFLKGCAADARWISTLWRQKGLKKFNSPMIIFILHHHLNTGGVTRVIEVQIDALKEAGYAHIELIVGSDVDLKRTDVPVHIVPELLYLQSGYSKDQLDHQLESLTTKLRNLWRTAQEEGSIFHIHNLCLGKNPLLNLGDTGIKI